MTESAYSGGGRITYPGFKKAWANVTFQRGARAMNSGAVLMEKVILVRLRPHSWLTDRCQIEWQGERFKITTMDQKKHEEIVQLKCEKVTNEESVSE